MYNRVIIAVSLITRKKLNHVQKNLNKKRGKYFNHDYIIDEALDLLTKEKKLDVFKES